MTDDLIRMARAPLPQVRIMPRKIWGGVFISHSHNPTQSDDAGVTKIASTDPDWDFFKSLQKA